MACLLPIFTYYNDAVTNNNKHTWYYNMFCNRAYINIDVVRTLRQKIIAVRRKLGIGVCLRTVVLIFCLTFFWVQMHMSDVADNETIQILAKPDGLLDANDSMLQLVPQVRFIYIQTIIILYLPAACIAVYTPCVHVMRMPRIQVFHNKHLLSECNINPHSIISEFKWLCILSF